MSTTTSDSSSIAAVTVVVNVTAANAPSWWTQNHTYVEIGVPAGVLAILILLFSACICVHKPTPKRQPRPPHHVRIDSKGRIHEDDEDDVTDDESLKKNKSREKHEESSTDDDSEATGTETEDSDEGEPRRRARGRHRR